MDFIVKLFKFVKQIFVSDEDDPEYCNIDMYNNTNNNNRSNINCILNMGVTNSLSSEDMYYPYEYNRAISHDDIESKGYDGIPGAQGLYIVPDCGDDDKKNK